MNYQNVIVEMPRDRYGRPLVMLNGTRVPYTRVTTFANTLDDQYNLTLWKLRNAVFGTAIHKDLQVAAAATDPNNKKRMNEIAQEALDFGVGHTDRGRAELQGTARHELAERIDRGQALGMVSKEVETDMRAYEKTTTGLDVKAIEQFRVHDDWRVAGTADRVVEKDGHHYIADLKTGSIDFPVPISLQLAMYAHCTPYDIETDTRVEDHPIDLHKAIIIHLPAGTGECFLHYVDIEKGWRGCQLAKQVREFRTLKGLTWEVPGDEPPRSFTFAELALMAADLDELRAVWREAKRQCAYTDTVAAAIETRRNQLGASA